MTVLAYNGKNLEVHTGSRGGLYVVPDGKKHRYLTEKQRGKVRDNDDLGKAKKPVNKTELITEVVEIKVNPKHSRYYRTLERVRKSGAHNMFGGGATRELNRLHPRLGFGKAREIQLEWIVNYEQIVQRYQLDM